MQSKSLFHGVSMAALLQMALQSSILVGLDLAQIDNPGQALALGRDSSTGARASAAARASVAARANSAKANVANDAAADGESKPEPPKRDYAAPVLGTLAKEYKDSPDDVTWGKYFTYLRDVLVSADFSQANPADLIAANPSLNDLHVKVIDAGAKNMHLWSFPSIVESHAVIFATPGKTMAIPLPLSIVLRDGRIVPSSFAAPAAWAATTKITVKGKGKKGTKIVRFVRSGKSGKSGRAMAASTSAGVGNSAALSSFGKYLVLIGGDRQTNALWLKGFKLSEGPLAEAPELFASLPLFFSQNVSGKAGFSGSDIVLTIQPPARPANLVKDPDEKPEMVIQANGKSMPVKPTNAAVAGYKVMLKYMGGKFALAGHLPDDAPLAIALAFAQNICAGRSDVAKAWLVDAKLVSIPKYLGLIGRTTPPMRLVAMSGASGARYRLITSAKDDLIIDVGRITTPGKMKGQLAIKGLFIAPPDPYAAKLAGTMVLPQESEKPNPDAEVSPDPDTKPATKAGTNSSTKSATKSGTKPDTKATVKGNLQAR
jgi:hypothetical protein